MANYYASARSNYFKLQSPEMVQVLEFLSIPFDHHPTNDEYISIEGEESSGSLSNVACFSNKAELDGHLQKMKELFDLDTDDRDELFDEVMEILGGEIEDEREDEDCYDCFVTFDLTVVIQQIVAEDHVAVIMEAGAEKLRYIVGVAAAISRDGIVTINIEDIYEKAKEAFGKDKKMAYCHYQDLPGD